MNELGVDLLQVRSCFEAEERDGYLFLHVKPESTARLITLLAVAVRRCYISDDLLAASVARTGQSPSEVLRAVLPDRATTMSGDFGELLISFLLASLRHPAEVRDPKKWRLKEARNRASLGTDIVQFLVPQWPAVTTEDALVCAEVKSKATAGSTDPINAALTDSAKDRSRRLDETLVWLRERAQLQDLGTVGLDVLGRFIDAIDHPAHERYFHAAAVCCSSLVEAELELIPTPAQDECQLVVVSVQDLKATYQAMFNALAPPAGAP